MFTALRRLLAALGSLLAALGPLLVALGCCWVALGLLLASLGARKFFPKRHLLRKCDVHEMCLKQAKNNYKCLCWPLFGSLGPLLGALGKLVVPSLLLLGAPGRSGCNHGTLLVALGALLAVLVALLGRPGSLLVALGPFL